MEGVGGGKDSRSETVVGADKGDAKNAGSASGAKNAGSSATKGAAQKPERELGQFHHLPHYVKLYDVLKSSHSNCRCVSGN